MSMMTDDDRTHTWTAFRAGTVPCEACGVAVHESRAEGVEPLAVTLGMVRGTGFSGEREMFPDTIDMPVGRCQVCQQIHDSAYDMLLSNWQVQRAIGDRSIALWRIELALYALDALGVTDPRLIDKYTGSAGALLKTIEALAVAGGQALWVTAARARRGQQALSQPPSPQRWAHVSPAARRALDEARVSMYVAANAKPAPIPATDEDGRPTGCMLCGVGAVLALPSEADQVWVQTMTDPETIGAKPAPDPIEGVLCPRCEGAVDRARGIGGSAMRISVLDFLGADYGPRWDDLAPHFSAVGWAALPSGARPNAAPWEHIDLEPLREAITEHGVPLYGDYRPLIPTAMPADAVAKAAGARSAPVNVGTPA